MIKIEQLYKSYKYHQVLKGLDMSVPSGSVYGFIGENGAGKTTTMNILCNVITKDSGLVTINDGAPYTVGYLPENPMLFGYMNASQYLEYIGACCNYQGNVKQRNAQLLQIVGLQRAAKRKIKGYSRGMNQRLGLAAAIYNDPDVIILDEPTSALDPQGRAEVMNIIAYLKSLGKTIILSTHILSDVERVADYVGILVGGKLIKQEPLDNLIGSGAGNTIVLMPQNNDESMQTKLLSSNLENISLNNFGDYEITVESKEKGLDIQKYLYENGILIERYYIKRPTLEEIYLKAVNENAD